MTFSKDDLSENDLSKYLKLGGDLEKCQPLSHKYYDTLTLFPEFSIFSDNIEKIMEELNNSQELWNNWCEIIKNPKKTDWEVIPIYGFGKFTQISEKFPFLKNLILNHKNIELISFSKLGKKTMLDPHQGWASTANVSVRSHLGLTVPEMCGLWVEGEIKMLEKGMWISFDDSKMHSAFNKSENIRIVLIIDIKKPKFIKEGTSTVKNPEHMDIYIKDS